MQKDLLRDQIRTKKIENYGENIDKYQQDSKNIAKKLLKFSLFKDSNEIGLFASKSTSFEPITDSIISKALLDGKSIYLPRCITESHQLEFIEITELDADTEIAAFSIREPRKELFIRNQTDFRRSMELLVVPGLAFDKYGNRIGYGSGYYDNFIKKYRQDNLNGIVIALCFNFQFMHEEIPHNQKDMRVDYIITQNKIYKSKYITDQ